MVNRKDATVIQKDKIPPGRVVGVFTFLRDMGKALEKDQAIQLTANDNAEAKKIQARWRSYFKGKAHSRKEVLTNGKFIVYLWLES